MSVNGSESVSATDGSVGDSVSAAPVTFDPAVSVSTMTYAPTKNTAVVVLGAQWGDEGKGKLIDILANDYDVVCR